MKTPIKKDNEFEFRKWCIEQAIRWPLSGNYAAAFPPISNEVNILDRAERIFKWVKNVK